MRSILGIAAARNGRSSLAQTRRPSALGCRPSGMSAPLTLAPSGSCRRGDAPKTEGG